MLRASVINVYSVQKSILQTRQPNAEIIAPMIAFMARTPFGCKAAIIYYRKIIPNIIITNLKPTINKVVVFLWQLLKIRKRRTMS